MIKVKIFMGNAQEMADTYANAWLEKNSHIEIIDMEYQQARYGDHSICILYREEK